MLQKKEFMTLASFDTFKSRHLGPRPSSMIKMLNAIGLENIDQLIDEAVPASIRLKEELDLPAAETEYHFLKRLKTIAQKNKLFNSFIGMGYYDCLTPNVILRNVFENPGWYTPYTPYQAEISQGRLEALLNYQTVVKDLTGMDIANASLLDEGTAAAESMTMMYRIQSRRHKNCRHTFLVSDNCFPQTLDILKNRAEPLGIDIKIQPIDEMVFDNHVFAALIQCPNDKGEVSSLKSFIDKVHDAEALVSVGSDLMALTLITPPGELGADVVFGNSQRFGVPMGFGGPHAAFYACKEEYAREIPGRIIGISKDARGHNAYRMALQTREQHIRREKAKSNICTAQALLANIVGFYAVWHGPEGLKNIATRIHQLTQILDKALKKCGLTQNNRHYFDTLHVQTSEEQRNRIEALCLKAEINLRYFEDHSIGISLDETTTPEDVVTLIASISKALNKNRPDVDFENYKAINFPEDIERTSSYLTHPVFHNHRSETAMMRYLKKLENKDIGLDHSMIPLGSCTMKLNAVAEMIPVTWPEFGQLHPFVPTDQCLAYHEIFEDLEKRLAEITGFDAVSLQPNSGAQGEFAGLMVIRAYHQNNDNDHRNIVMIPSSAHGTNPASGVMAGMKVVVVNCDDSGNIDIEDLTKKCEQHKDNLSALMITYPSTFGVFEEGIKNICDITHNNGGLVYMDGANMNAQVGLTSPAIIGADVCHLNLHKTFAIPHGGGGPGMGPIAVNNKLAPYLPGNPVVKGIGGKKAIKAISAAPWGSASINLISYAYMCLLGKEGMIESSKIAILNANYLKVRLQEHYDVLFYNHKGRVAHEMIFDLRAFKKSAGITEEDVAKRFMDYGYHAPTVSWPVVGTMMIEPTESESLAELDTFCDALIQIKKEIQDIIDNHEHHDDNLLKNAPHSAKEVIADWTHHYSRESAVYPLPFVKENKYWPPVSRIDNPYGDRNLICSCQPLENFTDE